MKFSFKIFIVAFIVRLIPFTYAYIYNPEGFLLFDSQGYLDLARNIYDNQIFSRATTEQSLISDATRTPIYPLFLLLFQFFGISIPFAVFSTLIIGCVNAILTYKIGQQVFANSYISKAAGLIVAIDIPSIYFSNVIMPETLFTFLLMISTLFYLHYHQNKLLKNIIVSGSAMSLAVLCKPIAFLLPLIFCVHMVWHKIKIKHITIYLSFVFALVGGWIIRNKTIFDIQQVSIISSVNLYYYTAASIKAEVNQLSLIEAQKQQKREAIKQHEFKDASDLKHAVSHMNQSAIKTILEHPLIFAKQTFIGTVFFLTKPLRNYINEFIQPTSQPYSSALNKSGGSSIWNKIKNNHPVTLILLFYQVIMTVLVLIGLTWGLILTKPTNYLLLLSVLIYFILFSSITEVDARLRVPAVPLMALLSSIVLGSKFISDKLKGIVQT